jgi:outer membrane lipoprotein-sorting protein
VVCTIQVATYAHKVKAWHRWLVVVICTALVIGVPLAVRERPASSSPKTADQLLRMATASRLTPYSGYVEALGTLQLPVAQRLEELGPLLGERSRLRVWWSSPDRWRVDQIRPTGESDYFHRGDRTLTWTYEDFGGVVHDETGVRLPQPPDLTPPELAHYLLDGADTENLSTLAADRVAGRSAAGLRVTPSDPRSSIDHVDVWLDEASGVPLRVSVFDKVLSRVAVTSTFLDFSTRAPDGRTLAFQPPPGASIDHRDSIDLADAANRFIPVQAPATVAGFQRVQAPQLRGVGTYGTGLTRFVVIPLEEEAAGPIRRQFLAAPNVQLTTAGPAISVGALAVGLTEWSTFRPGGGWLVAGTLTPEALTTIVKQLGDPQPTEQLG